MTPVLSFPDAPGRGGPALPRGPAGSDAPPDPSTVTLSEAWSSAADAGTAAFVLAALRRPGPVLWVQDRVAAREAGRPYGPGLRRDVLHVTASRAADVLAALEMGLGCPALAGVVGEVWGDPPRLDFTATKRLALRAERGDVPCWLIRRAATPGLSAARERWRVVSLPSAPDPFDARAPGTPRWRAELFRSRSRRPGLWVASSDGGMRDDGTPDHLRFAAVAGDGPLAGDPVAPAGRAAR